MARFSGALASETTATVILLVIVLCNNMWWSAAAADVSAPFLEPMAVTILPPHAGSNRRTMFVPLFPSLPNSSRVSSFFGDGDSRRRLFDNARMNLHDDLSTTGYHSARLWIGTPPQKFALIVDTGSSVTYVPCSTCQHCGQHQDPKFDPDSSRTYEPVRCNIDCTCDDIMHQCTYLRQYAEMSSSSGVIGTDIISFGNQTGLSPQRATFGCENMETGSIYSQRADGILGLGRGDLSLVNQLVDQGVISNSFSLCYGGMDVGGGAMVLGGITPPSGMVFAYSNPLRSQFYNVDLKELHVAGKRLAINSSVFDDGEGTILDSGTTYASLPEAAFLAFTDALMDELHTLKQIEGPYSSYNDICFSGAGSDISKLPERFPSVEMVFGEGHKLLLSPENYLFRHTRVRGAYCLGIYQSSDATTILGGIIARNIFAMYDREHHRIGFWKTNCSDLLARLNASGVINSTPDKPHSNSYPSPLAPFGPPNHLSLGLKVGSIIFHMSLDTKYSKLEHQITELTRLISMELNVKDSQVYLLDSMSKPSGSSLTIWVINPPKPAKYMSKEIASNIIARIEQDEIQLPESFGKHRITYWYIESAPHRTWWQKYRDVVIGILLVFVSGFVTLTIRWMYKHRNIYKFPYRTIRSGEHQLELQPMW